MNRDRFKPNYILLINRFWDVNLEYNFSGNETKLYFYLLHVSNSLGWKNPFRNSLRQIRNGTGISINSIKSAQKRLIESGLISVSPGIAGNRFNYQNKTEYTLSVSNFDTQQDTQPNTRSDTQKGTQPDTINKLNETKQLFDRFRQAYPGTKRGLDTEFENFMKKYNEETTVLLIPALEKEINHKQKLKDAKQFCPEWKNLSTWINQRCWEQELPPIEAMNGKAVLTPAKGLTR